MLDTPLSLAGYTPSDTSRAVVVGVVLATVLAQMVYILVVGKSLRRGACLVLVGESGAGKSTVYQVCLAGGSSTGLRRTHTSMEENRGLVPEAWLNKMGSSAQRILFRAPLPILDLPGHPSLRYKLDDAVADAAAVVFVVDSVAAASPESIAAAAEHLFSVFIAPGMITNRIPLLVFCNKTDIASARSPLAIQNMLEEEIVRVRQSHAARLSDADGENDDAAAALTAVLGSPDAPFTFDALPFPVRFASGSAIRPNGCDDIREFVTRSFS